MHKEFATLRSVMRSARVSVLPSCSLSSTSVSYGNDEQSGYPTIEELQTFLRASASSLLVQRSCMAERMLSTRAHWALRFISNIGVVPSSGPARCLATSSGFFVSC